MSFAGISMDESTVVARSFKSHVRAHEGNGMVASVVVELWGFSKEKSTIEQAVKVTTWRMRTILGSTSVLAAMWQSIG
jgi:hypothetical protein